MVNRLVSVDEGNNLPPEVQTALVGSVETYFETLTTRAESAADDAANDSASAASSKSLAETARDEAEAAAASATAPTDTMVSSLLADSGSATREAVGTLVESGYKVFVDTDFPSLAAAVSATTSGSTLRVFGTYSLAATLVIDKPMTVEFVTGSSLTTATAIDAVQILSSNVTLKNPRIIGTGNATAGLTKAIFVKGLVGAYLSNIHILDAHISSFNKDGIWMEYVTQFSVQNMNIHDMAYSGVITISCTDGRIEGGRIKNITKPAGFPQCYGIALTRDSNLSMSDSPRTENVVVTGVTVENVNWEGIDTHAGKNLTITNNTVLGCHIGIAMVPCPDPTGNDAWAAIGMICTNNYIDSRVSNGSKSNGIIFVGAGVLGAVVEYANGIVSNNIVVDHGTDSSNQGLWGGILLSMTRGVIISNNLFVRPTGAGIQLYHSNREMVLSANVIEDVWSEAGGTSVAFYVRSTTNNASITGTQISRGSKSATYVNTVGLRADLAGSVMLISDGSNRWSKATTAVVAPVSAVRFSFFGAPDIQQPTIRAAATDAATALALANDLRAKLISLGIMV